MFHIQHYSIFVTEAGRERRALACYAKNLELPSTIQLITTDILKRKYLMMSYSKVVCVFSSRTGGTDFQKTKHSLRLVYTFLISNLPFLLCQAG